MDLHTNLCPDDSFETYLESNGLGNGISNDDNVYTSAIDTVSDITFKQS